MKDSGGQGLAKEGRKRAFMSLQTFEGMLHYWPQWQQSIREARKLPEMGCPLPDSYEGRQKWIEQHGGWAWQFATKVMRDLGLPEHLFTYWLCCVHSEYEAADGSTDYSKILDFHGKDRCKTYPPPPYRVLISGDIKRPGKFEPVSVEVHPSFAYRALLDEAALHARHVAESFNGGKLHPVFGGRQKAKGQSQRSPRKSEIRARFRSGRCSLEDILREEAESPAVQSDIEQILKKNKIERRSELKKLRRRVLARVRARLSDLGPLPRVKGKWWLYNNM